MTSCAEIAPRFVLPAAKLQRLIDALAADGYHVWGPTIDDRAISYREIRDVAELPRGWTDRQSPGSYRLERRQDDSYFGYASASQSWKPNLFAPRVRLYSIRKKESDLEFRPERPETTRLALLGARSCDLRAIAVQDRVFASGRGAELDYAAQRAAMFVVAIQCVEAGETCFCDSMQTGPRAETGFDLALTELIGDRHRFIVEIGSERGGKIVETLGLAMSGEADTDRAKALVGDTARSMRRRVETTGLKARLEAQLEHPRWDRIAERCLSCANCTLVCPTCFCSSTEDRSSLDGQTAERWRRWDSCFSLDHSAVHGGSIRASIRARYRQWLTHKFAYWIDQFGESGCVGCGRCITWCPAGIELTEELAALAPKS